MAYTKQTWADLPSKTTPINATRLTHIEDGIYNAAATADTAASTAGTAAANVGIVSGKVETLTERVNGLDTAVSNKVDKVAGKGLSTNDYDNTDKGKVDSLGTASTKNSTSVVTESSDLVESGAVYDAIVDTVGWVEKNLVTTITEGYSIQANGNISSNSNFNYINNCEVIPFETYKYKARHTAEGGTTYRVHGYDASDNWVKQIAALSISKVDDFEIKFKIDNPNIKYVKVSMSILTSNYELIHISVNEQKCDNSVIGTVEDGTNPTKAYSVGEHFIRNGKFCTCIVPVTTASTWSDSYYTSDDVGSNIGRIGTGIECNSIADIIVQVNNRSDFCNFIKTSGTLSSILTNNDETLSGKLMVTMLPNGNYDWFGMFGGGGFAIGRFNSNGRVSHNVIL